MQLKTLKEIKCIYCGDETFGQHDTAGCERQQIREEAIKHIKDETIKEEFWR